MATGRGRRAETVLQAYRLIPGCDPEASDHTVVTDFLTDLLHLVAEDPERVEADDDVDPTYWLMQRAGMAAIHFEAEVSGDEDDEDER